MKNIWILSEERPKKSILKLILNRFFADQKIEYSIDQELSISPMMENGKFTFYYKIGGVNCGSIGEIYLKLAGGNSSFVDYLVFFQETEPDPSSSKPIYAIEETKTDDAESRNTGVYQRLSKFVFVEFYYPGIKKIMLYNLQVQQKDKQSSTNIFGTRMLTTLGVEVIGKILDENLIKPFESLDELIEAKSSMRMPPKGNVPIKIGKYDDRITISGRLFKSDGLSHDPNIGALSAISMCIRKWEREKPIEIISHGLSQEHIGRSNKFIHIAKELNIRLLGLTLPESIRSVNYWSYCESQEKIASIFIHLAVENLDYARVIYENHGGCERGYFLTNDGSPLAISKYQDGKREEYKAGNKNSIIFIPDLIIDDTSRNEIINVEGKTYTNMSNGISELNNYDYIEDHYIKVFYNPSAIKRTVVLYGSTETEVKEPEVGFLLNKYGELILGPSAPEIFKDAVNKILS